MAGIGDYKKGGKFTLKSGNSPMFKNMGSSPIRAEVDPTVQAMRDEREAKHEQLKKDIGSLDKESIHYEKRKERLIKKSQGLKTHKKDTEGMTKEEFVKETKRKKEASKAYVKSKGGMKGLNMKKDDKGVYRNPEGYTIKELRAMEEKTEKS
tara:strand:- start:64 stop:519 length:456 start_codon:yes stop_codon:yes gene_type:complete